MDSFSILPDDIISDIITRLPAESVLDCKSICKTWRNLIQHPSFCKMHSDRLSNHSATASSADCFKLGFLAFTGQENFYYFDYIKNKGTPIDKFRRIKLTPQYKYNTFIGSVNGLMCLRHNDLSNTLCVCNPVTKEYVILPDPKRNSGRYNYTSIGFAYVSSTNEYKVVMVNKVNKEPNFVEVVVYTLGSGSGWRNIGKFDLKFNGDYFVIGVFLNGSLHWMDVYRRMIMVFDLADENFREPLSTPLPPVPVGSYDIRFGVLTGFLFCQYVYLPSVSKHWFSDTWLYKKKNDNNDMKEQQDQHLSYSWVKEFTSATHSVPLAFTKTGDILGYRSSYLDIYDPKASTSKTLVDIKEEFRRVFPHRNTLVSLKALGEEDTKTMQSLGQTSSS